MSRPLDDPARTDLSGLRIAQRPITLREQVLNALRDAILTFKFKPGERLTERALCELTGVSRTSVREALRHLESEGLIENIPHRGPIVAIVTIDQAQHIYELRGAIEGLAARLFAERADDASIRSLRAALDQVAISFQTHHQDEILKAVNAFYDALLAGCKNPLIGRALKSLHGRIIYLRALSTSHAGRALESLRELADIVTAIEGRDPVAAEQACRQHAALACEAAIAVLASKEPGK